MHGSVSLPQRQYHGGVMCLSLTAQAGIVPIGWFPRFTSVRESSRSTPTAGIGATELSVQSGANLDAALTRATSHIITRTTLGTCEER